MSLQGLLYLVKWEGFHEDDSTWEPQSHLDVESMSNFFPAFISVDRLNSAARLFEDVIQQRLRPNNRTESTNLRFDLDVYRYCFNTDESVRIDSLDSLKKVPLSNGWNYKLNRQGYVKKITFPFRLRPKRQMRKNYLRKDDGSVETKFRPIEIVKIISASKSFWGSSTCIYTLHQNVGQFDHTRQKANRELFTNSGGRQKAKLDLKFTKIAIFEKDILLASELTSSLEKFAEENVSLADQFRIISKQIKEAEEQRKLDSPAANISKPHEIDPILINHGKKFQEASKTERYEKIKTLTNKVDKALWFFESYGLKPSSLKLTTVSGEPVKQLDLADKDDETRWSMDLEKMKAVLFILDKFKISDQAYHEIVRKTEDLPRLHSIVRLREKTNSTFEIYRTTGNIPGAYVSLKSELENCFKKFETLPSETIKIKISGNGTRVTRISNFIVLSFFIISETAKLSADEQTVLAIVKTSESYENLSSSLHHVFGEINEL
ncbi:unnamed protein product [Mytilus coruscus]|uniref:Chromo domain-containing protein n=1 Tax=Mytilus coruscus TaxID=42192 RepID=A0A6J8CQX4_MYTCO|nr:unnamed protein product [Mytilus coruscus]